MSSGFPLGAQCTFGRNELEAFAKKLDKVILCVIYKAHFSSSRNYM